MTKCEEGILRTLAFFDVFDYSPTLLELYRWQLKTDRVYTTEEVRAALVTLGGKVLTDGVLYSLPGRSLDARAHQRRLRAVHALRKNKKVWRYVARIARFVWGIRGIAVCNTRLPFLYAENNSDIDLLIIARQGRIWSVRFMLVGILKVLRLRPGEVSQDAFDHSMFIADHALALQEIADQNPVYMAAWVASLDPVFGNRALFEQIEKENAWVRTIFPAYVCMERVPFWRHEQRVWWRLSRIALPLLWAPENIVRTWQSRHFTNTVANKLNASSSVVANDHMLKFHTTDKRKAYWDIYQSLCSSQGVSA